MQTDSTLGPKFIIYETEPETGYIVSGSYTGTIPTTASKFALGATVTDRSTGTVYRNGGTVAVPSWQNVDSISTAEIADLAVTNAKIATDAAIAFSKLAALTSTNILVGNGSNVPTAVAMSGDATMANTGAVTIANLAVTGAKMANATVTRTQMSASAGLTSIQSKLGDIATAAGATDTYIRVSKSGTISAITMLLDSNLATSDTNYITFTATNLTGTKVLLNASGANNTTKVTGGTAITAEASRTMNLTATGGDLVVAAGDWIRVTATVTGTLANTVVQNNVCIDMTGTE